MVGSDTAQGRSDALFMVNKLNAKKVVIVDDQEAYSTGLAAAATAILKANNVTVQRESVNQKVTDFSSLVTKIPSDASVVFLPWQVAANGQLFAEQMKEQGKTAKVFGSDGLDSGDFTITGAYVSSFARDIHGLPEHEGRHRRLQQEVRHEVEHLRPAVVRLGAGCRDCVQEGLRRRQGVTRRAAEGHPRREDPNSILGITVSFDKHGDVPAAKFYVSQIQSDGSHKLVG